MYEYHNHTFWPWTTGNRNAATSRFRQYQECDVLLSKLAPEEHPHIHSFYEWIDPIEDHPEGSFPFRTGISAVRIAIADITQRIKKGS